MLEAQAELPESALEILGEVVEAAGAREGGQKVVDVGKYKWSLIGRPDPEQTRPPTRWRTGNGQSRRPQELLTRTAATLLNT